MKGSLFDIEQIFLIFFAVYYIGFNFVKKNETNKNKDILENSSWKFKLSLVFSFAQPLLLYIPHYTSKTIAENITTLKCQAIYFGDYEKPELLRTW